MKISIVKFSELGGTLDAGTFIPLTYELQCEVDRAEERLKRQQDSLARTKRKLALAKAVEDRLIASGKLIRD